MNSSKSTSGTPFSLILNLGSLLTMEDAGDGADGLVGLNKLFNELQLVMK